MSDEPMNDELANESGFELERPTLLKPRRVPEGFPGRVTFVKSAAKPNQSPNTALPEIALCGRSNVGKSSLINTLCNRRQLARVSTMPGRTRLINFFNVQDTLMLVDLPGYGFARGDKEEVASWGKVIHDYLDTRKQLALALVLVDTRRGPEAEEEELLLWFQQAKIPQLVILTKSDKVKKSEIKLLRRQYAAQLNLLPGQLLTFSALNRTGKDELWGYLLAYAAAFTPQTPPQNENDHD